MKLLRKLFILGVAAGTGTLVYQVQHAPRPPGLPPAREDDRSTYSYLSGAGGLLKTIENGENIRIGEKPSGGIGSVGGGIGPVGTGPRTGFKPGGSNSSSYASSSPVLAKNSGPLLTAAADGDKAKVSELIEQHVKIDSRDIRKRTPLMYAAWNNHTDVIVRLLAAGASLALEDDEGYNALDYAAGRGQPGTVALMLKQGRARDDTHALEFASLMAAVYTENASALPKDKITSINRIGPEGFSALHLAAANGSAALADALVARGANINLANSRRQTPLHIAAWNNRPEMIRLLADKGARINMQDAEGNTPLMLAAQRNATDAAKTLLAAGADKYLANTQGKTAGIIADDQHYGDLVGLLK